MHTINQVLCSQNNQLRLCLLNRFVDQTKQTRILLKMSVLILSPWTPEQCFWTFCGHFKAYSYRTESRTKSRHKFMVHENFEVSWNFLRVFGLAWDLADSQPLYPKLVLKCTSSCALPVTSGVAESRNVSSLHCR